MSEFLQRPMLVLRMGLLLIFGALFSPSDLTIAQPRSPATSPKYVFLFLSDGGGMAHGGCYGGITRGQRLSLVQSLGGHLAGMIDPHQPGRPPALRRAERFVLRGGRRRARGLGGSE